MIRIRNNSYDVIAAIVQSISEALVACIMWLKIINKKIRADFIPEIV